MALQHLKNIRPVYWIWFVVTGAPFVIGILFLEYFYNDGKTWIEPVILSSSKTDGEVFATYLNYFSFATFHIVCSIVAILLVAREIARLATDTKQLVMILCAVGLVFYVAVLASLRFPEPSAVVQSTYGYVCRMLRLAEVLPQFAPGACFNDTNTLLAWITALQLFFGYGTAILVGSFVFGVIMCPTNLAIPERAEKVEFAFRIVALTLVSGTIGILLFLRTPLALTEDAEVAGNMATYAQSITLFWGAEFTLSMLILFGPAILVLRQNATKGSAEHEIFDDGSSLKAVLGLKPIHAIGVFAPIIVGLLTKAAEHTFGAL